GKRGRQGGVPRPPPGGGLVSPGWDIVDGEGRPLPHQGWSRDEGDVLPRLLLGNLAHPVAVVLRRAQILDAGGFDETLQANEDWDLFLRLTLRGARGACVAPPLGADRGPGGQGGRDGGGGGAEPSPRAARLPAAAAHPRELLRPPRSAARRALGAGRRLSRSPPGRCGGAVRGRAAGRRAGGVPGSGPGS